MEIDFKSEKKYIKTEEKEKTDNKCSGSGNGDIGVSYAGSTTVTQRQSIHGVKDIDIQKI